LLRRQPLAQQKHAADCPVFEPRTSPALCGTERAEYVPHRATDRTRRDC
jgi:hypothetical protein